jgi:hypothetical protein
MYTVACSMLQHPYEGLYHDSILYSLSALARLHPESLGTDIFLRFGSQDQYTIFSPIFAAAIRLAGLERAAAVLTLATHIAFFSCAWLLARRIMRADLALLGVGLLIALPSDYGGMHIFKYAEEFLTARQPAETLVLVSVTMALVRRHILMGVCLLAAALLHPIMAAAGIVFVLSLRVAIPRPKLALGVAAAGLAALGVTAFLTPFGPFSRFDAEWFQILHSHFGYLFPSQWLLADWGRAAVPLGVLAVGAILSREPVVRTMCGAALITACCGLGLTLLGFDLLHIIIVGQAQPWRWLWIANALAVLLIPVIVNDCWRAGQVARASTVLLATAWICMDEHFVMFVVLLAVACAAAADHVRDPRHGRLILLGAWGALLIGTLLFVGTVLNVTKRMPLVELDTSLYDSDLMLAIRHFRPWASGGILPAFVLAVAWWISRPSGSRRNLVPLIIVASAACALFAPFAWKFWTRSLYSEQARAAFAAWRDSIPQRAEILWPDNPLGAWYLLERPSYWSLAQAAGALFSRAGALESLRRARIAASLLTPAEVVSLNLERTAATSPTLQGLSATCRTSEAGFIVTWSNLGPTPFPAIAPSARLPNAQLRLYRCADLRG